MTQLSGGDGGLTVNPAAEAAARFQQLQRSLMGFELREALKHSPVFNPSQALLSKSLS